MVSNEQSSLFEIAVEMGDISVARLKPEVLEEARLQRIREVARRTVDPAPLPESGYNLWAEICSATIQGDGIEISIRIHGQVQRPEALATATAAVLQLKVPAEVEWR